MNIKEDLPLLMKQKNMAKVKKKNKKYVKSLLIEYIKQSSIAEEQYPYKGYGYSLNYEQNIQPIIDELENMGYVF